MASLMGEAILTGCLLRHNKHLMSESSIPVSFECSGSAEERFKIRNPEVRTEDFITEKARMLKPE